VIHAWAQSGGKFLKLREELKIADDTLVFYSTDYGPHYDTGRSRPGCKTARRLDIDQAASDRAA
jgi:hypothetical protein